MSNTPLTQEEVLDVQNFIGAVSAFCANPAYIDLLKRYLDQSRPQYNGTLDTVLLHRMSIQDLEKSKRNLKMLCEMGLRINQIREIRETFIAQQEKDNVKNRTQ